MSSQNVTLTFDDLNVELPVALVSTLKKLGTDESIKWFPNFTLSTKTGGSSYLVESHASALGADGEIEGCVVVTINGEEGEPIEYDSFWDVVEETELGRARKLNSFKFADTISGALVTRKRGSDSKTVISLESGWCDEVNSKDKVMPLFECDLKLFAKSHPSRGLDILVSIF
jgi:hypothetical protein